MDEFDYFQSHPVVSQPLLQFASHYKAARCTTGLWTHNFILSTVDSEVGIFYIDLMLQGQPHGRTVSLHTFDERGFCFCTNYDGPKAAQLGENIFVKS